ncbi:MAG: sugar phosphate isomerase/epimerase [Burkholderiales bacterium]|nr:sugar phosphate isomerase/epimerase [Anaerolineae bacterium]
MQLGFVTAIVPEFTLEEVFAYAAEQKFGCVEVMCWPAGKAERRYAGVTHIDVTNFTSADVERIKALSKKYGVAISGLGYYPNPLAADADERNTYFEHIKKVIAASALLGVNVMNTFVGRDPAKSIEDNWPLFEQLWPPIIEFAESQGVRVGIENCPMLFSLDEWPGGKNLAISPDVWRRMFTRIPSKNFGLNFDPSHLIWQHIDYVRAIHEFGDRLVHVHAKDTKIDHDMIYQRGITGFKWHIPKLPGLGDVQWGPYFSALKDVGYDGPVCIEVEDRAYEATLDLRKRALTQSKRYLEPFMAL